MAKAPVASSHHGKPDPLKRAVVSLIENDPLDFSQVNPAQARFIDAIRHPVPNTLNVVLFLKGNGLGGTWATVMAWSAIIFGTENPRFDGAPFGAAWPFMKSARLVSTVECLSDKGAIQRGIRELFPVAQWKQSRGAGKPYFSEGETDTGWDWDVKTYDQTPQQAAGGNKGLVIFSEPPPRDMFVECCTRLRGNGLIIVEMTQLDMADWIEDIADKDTMIFEGRKVGSVRTVRADVHENCRDCYPPDENDPSKPCGQRRHSEIDADIALWPHEEREARRTGRPLSRTGLVCQNWSDANEIDKLPEFHQRCWDDGRVRVWCSVNPHDRLPWPIVWGATFPNEDAVLFAEWPSFPWHECKSSPITHFDDYRHVILEAEAQMPEIATRIMDPLFGEAINTQSGFNLFKKLAGPCRACEPKNVRRETAVDEEREKLSVRCPHSLEFRHGVAYPGSVNAGHILVRAAIGDPSKGIRPKLYALKGSCPNMIYSVRHYGYKVQKDRTKGPSDQPQLINKEVFDVIRLAYLSKLDRWPPETKPFDLWSGPKQRGRGTTSAG